VQITTAVGRSRCGGSTVQRSRSTTRSSSPVENSTHRKPPSTNLSSLAFSVTRSPRRPVTSWAATERVSPATSEATTEIRPDPVAVISTSTAVTTVQRCQ
jgi:hypothetical protein